MSTPFQEQEPTLDKVRVPQRETFEALATYAAENDKVNREVGIILPVGCGKSGCITLAPFAFGSQRTLVVAPGLRIASQLAADFDPSNEDMFYQKCGVLDGSSYPEPVEIRGTTTNRADLEEAHVVITNIQQLQGGENKWLHGLPKDFFDLILFDEGHHSVAQSWATLKKHFPKARIVNFSATPLRADGQLMAGRVLYSYSVFRAIQAGYVKRLKAVQLNPKTLSYVRRKDGKEIEVDLEEVRRLGETEADFRRSIVTSKKTLDTIVDASIRELEKLRKATGEKRLKIIASALNFEHCRQIVEAYKERGLRAGYVHSKEDGAANKKVFDKLEAHDLDVIVQVRMLGEGFDHRYLSVAAVFSIFSNLSPFVQFVGRIMRVIVQDSPGHIVNQGVVVFHAGANVARQWTDFQNYSEADREYFAQLLPMEGVDPSQFSREIVPTLPQDGDKLEVKAQSDVQLEEIHLLKNDEAEAIRLLKERGFIPGEFDPTKQRLQPVFATRARQRQAKRDGLDMRVKTEAARILARRKTNPGGRNLDKKCLGKTNLIVMKSAIDSKVNAFVARKAGERHEFSREELDRIDAQFSKLSAAAESEVFGGN